MPHRAILKPRWNCDFCKRFINTKVTAVIKHENEKCWHNPVLRSCITCVHEEYVQDSDAWYRACLHPEGHNEMDAVLESLIQDETPMPVVGCKWWVSKEAT